MMTRLVAVIVTRNRKDKLSLVLAALARQTRCPDLTLVVDNASDDGTAAFLAERMIIDPKLKVHRLPHNIGGAGGFAEGIAVACAMGAQQLWVSDDDAYPAPDAIEVLVTALDRFEVRHGRQPSFACSRVEWVDGTLCEMNTPRVVWDWPRFMTHEETVALIDSCSFVSILIPRWAVEQHGLPLAEYFIWFDDAEYTRRLSRSHPGIFCAESRVRHDIEANHGVNFSYVTIDNVWKFRYGARNEASFRLRREGWVSFLIFVDQVLRQMACGKVRWRLRMMIFLSACSGLFFNPQVRMLPRVPSALSAEQVQL